MKLTRSQILVSILFFIFIVAIGAYYIFTYKNDSSYTTLTNNNNINNDNQKKIKNTVKKYTKEDFADDSTGVDDDLKEEINRELAKLNVNDATTQNKIFTYITSLAKLLNKYNYIDAPITVNNNGKVCDAWGNYSNGAYSAYINSCINVPGQIGRTCLNNNNLISCSKYYEDGQIESLNNINTNDLLNNSKYNIYLAINDVNVNLNKANVDMTNILTDYISKRNLENQQLYFIKYNEYNLDDKQKMIDKTNKEFEKTENDVNINKIQFQQVADQNTLNDTKKAKYYNYSFYLIIFIIIVGFLNFMFSKI